MSSNEDDYNDGEGSSRLFQTMKKRRIQRACDICRRKKIRCDGVQMPGNRCSNCIAYSFSCTYIEAAKKRGPPKGYVESLENRLERLDKLLRRLCPDETLYKELNNSIDNWSVEPPPAAPSSITDNNFSCPQPPGHKTPFDTVTTAIRGMTSDAKPTRDMTEDDDETALLLADSIKRMQLDPQDYRFFGKSSGAMLIRTALELKNEYYDGAHVSHVDSLHPSKPQLKNQRKEFWTTRPWEKDDPDQTPSPKFTFPEPDLAQSCIDLYFSSVNLYLPLLHRPSFLAALASNLHLTNPSFAHVYLLVCAVGARYSKDPRVRLDGVDSFHSSGWKWFDQVQMAKKGLLTPPTLYDLQRLCLSVQFLQGSSAPQSCWTLVGIGIRLAQDVGAHRRKLNNHTLTPEDEQWKRAFWVLVCMDRMVSSSLGRPCAIHDEDFDLDLPVDCDDEYWENEDPAKRFKQPPGKPSLITAFILYLKLHQILAFSLRTIYSINKSKILLGFVGQQWEQHIVAELDSALNKWVDSVPDHLRWDPNREDPQFFNQSVTLYAQYYHIQILIHRPFIPSPSKPSPLSFPSLAICTNAARSCSHVIDIQRRRGTERATIPPIQVCMAVFTSGIVLLLSIWGGKRSGLTTDPNKEMADVHKCMQALRNSEHQWHSAGRLWDILYELASVGELPLPQPSPPGGANKRERDSETPISATASEVSLSSMTGDGPRNIAGSKRAKDAERRASQQEWPVQQQRGGVGVGVGQSMGQPSMRRPASHSHLGSQAQAQMHQHHDSSSASPLSGSMSMSGIQSQGQQQQQQQPATPVECFALPVYSNELGRIPLHGGITFSAQAPVPPPASALGQVQQQQQRSNYWYSTPSGSSDGSASASVGAPSPSDGLGGMGIGIGVGGGGMLPHHVNVTHGHGHGNPMSSSSNGFGSIGEMSSMAVGVGVGQGFGMDPAEMVMFDDLAGTLGYGSGGSSFGVDGAGSMGQPSGQGQGSSSAAGLEGGYRGMAMDLRGDGRSQGMSGLNGHGHGHQHQQTNGGGGSGGGGGADEMYAFVDNDTIAMWSNAPTGFELDEWGTYLTNVSELTQGHGQHPSASG
ncbi:hypothetical protein GALMADRAFT_256803 [Galerina marginata CBS 339.88]|uniref:Zn(2)-C6 fungal-type domain-containing protein n=1 Tax=Galerina marginata (strain CBS 339.88) TaxID=685588 RepID=A0A067SCA0_GALM3|nr:hypothetical protein GALMADRAFT_256803 [Galerina marginata CBS 339.88]